jgi:hypothetical protein
MCKHDVHSEEEGHSMTGRAIRIFLVDGTPGGLRTVEIGLSTAKAVIASRSALTELSRREESRRTGVYVLIGDDPAIAGRAAVYVGEGDDVLQRILAHDKDPAKDFWDRVALFVSKDHNLTKAHVRYLEARLVEAASAAKRATVFNKVTPIGGKLPEADAAEVDEFLDHIRIMLSTSGVTAFEAVQSLASAKSTAPDELALSMTGDGYAAQCALREGEFVVLKDSVARAAEAPSLSQASRALRSELLTTGVVERRADGALRFLQDFAFGSASGSAQVICGANVNGKATWRLVNGSTLKDWQESTIATVVEA